MSTWLPGQEGDGAAEIDGEAALDAAEDDALDAVAGGVLGLELVPGGFAAGAVAGQHRFAIRVLDPVDIDLDLVADGQFGLLAGRGEFAQRHAAFGFQADVDDGEVVLDRGDDAVDDAAFEAFILAAEGFVEHRGEIVARGGCRCGQVELPLRTGPHRGSDEARGPGQSDLPQRPHADAASFGRKGSGNKRARRERLTAGPNALPYPGFRERKRPPDGARIGERRGRGKPCVGKWQLAPGEGDEGGSGHIPGIAERVPIRESLF